MADQKLKTIDDITGSIEAGLHDLWESDRYKNYLKVMSKFHNYSLNNNILIYNQCPGASRVAGYSQWQQSFHRHVKRGESAIKIIAPQIVEKEVTREEKDKDGKTVTVSEMKKYPVYRVAYVFDVSQTEGAPLPEIVESLPAKVDQYEDFLEAVKRSSPVPVEMTEIEGTADGYFVPSEQVIKIRKDLPEAQTISALIHEIAHSRVHNYDHPEYGGKAVVVEPKEQRQEEIEAESISYTVCQFFGIDSSKNSFGYISEWCRDKNTDALRQSLETIKNASGLIISDIEERWRDIKKEKGQDLRNAVTEKKDDLAVIKNPLGIGKPDGFALIKGEYKDDRHFSVGEVVAVGKKAEMDSLMASMENGLPAPYAADIKPPLEGTKIYKVGDDIMTLDMLEGGVNFAFTIYRSDDLSISNGGITNYDEWDIDEPDRFGAAAKLIAKSMDAGEKDILSLPDTFFEDLRNREREMLSEKIKGTVTDVPERARTEIAKDIEAMDRQNYMGLQGLDFAPDITCHQSELWNKGYYDGNMLPVSRLRASELFGNGVKIYKIGANGTKYRVTEADRIKRLGEPFAVERMQWKEERDRFPTMKDRDISSLIEKRFEKENGYGDAVVIWQKDKTLPEKCSDDRKNYLAKYEAPLFAKGMDHGEYAEFIRRQFTTMTPQSFMGRQLGSGDVITLRLGRETRNFKLLERGFEEVPEFFKFAEKERQMAVPSPEKLVKTAAEIQEKQKTIGR